MIEQYKDKEAPFEVQDDYPPERYAYEALEAINNIIQYCDLEPWQIEVLGKARTIARAKANS